MAKNKKQRASGARTSVGTKSRRAETAERPDAPIWSQDTGGDGYDEDLRTDGEFSEYDEDGYPVDGETWIEEFNPPPTRTPQPLIPTFTCGPRVDNALKQQLQLDPKAGKKFPPYGSRSRRGSPESQNHPRDGGHGSAGSAPNWGHGSGAAAARAAQSARYGGVPNQRGRVDSMEDHFGRLGLSGTPTQTSNEHYQPRQADTFASRQYPQYSDGEYLSEYTEDEEEVEYSQDEEQQGSRGGAASVSAVSAGEDLRYKDNGKRNTETVRRSNTDEAALKNEVKVSKFIPKGVKIFVRQVKVEVEKQRAAKEKAEKERHQQQKAEKVHSSSTDKKRRSVAIATKPKVKVDKHRGRPRRRSSSMHAEEEKQSHHHHRGHQGHRHKGGEKKEA